MLLKNALSYLCESFVDSNALRDDVDPAVRPSAHSIRGVSASKNFLKNWFICNVLEAVTWRSNSVFANFRFKEIQYVFDNCCSLGSLSWLRR